MDRLENEVAYNRSIFHDYNQKFWLKSVSWQYAKRVGGYKIDAWHLSKSIMIVCFLFVAFFLCEWGPVFDIYADLPLLGIEWNLTFVLFYNVIFKK